MLYKQLTDKLHYDPDSGVFTWNIKVGSKSKGSIAGTRSTKGYINIQVNNKIYKAHRLAFLYMLGVMPEDQVDHINRDRSDNKWSNLRLSNSIENARNRKTPNTNTSGVKGVYKTKHNKWRALIHDKGKLIHLGCFNTFEDAVKARSSAEFDYGYLDCKVSSAYNYLNIGI